VGLSHSEVRPILCEAFRRVFGREPTRPEAQFAHAVAELETSCGDGWADPAHDAANNFGAIQKGSWTGSTFRHKDSRPRDDGTSEWYEIEFRAYPTPVAGIEDLVKVVYKNKGRDKAVLPPAATGDSLGVSRGLYQTVYYQGFGRTAEERIGHHHLALTKALERIARALGEPLPDGSEAPPEPPRVLKIRCQGEDVRLMQLALGIKPADADGIFGPKTRAAVIAWQRLHRLKPDGVFGPVSRKVLEEEIEKAPDTLPDPSVRHS
jgi:hypothetical protein